MSLFLFKLLYGINTHIQIELFNICVTSAAFLFSVMIESISNFQVYEMLFAVVITMEIFSFSRLADCVS